MITYKQIQNKLAEAIKQSGMTQAEIAKQLGIIQQSVQQYVAGRALPSLETFANLCKLLDIDANYILCLD